MTSNNMPEEHTASTIIILINTYKTKNQKKKPSTQKLAAPQVMVPQTLHCKTYTSKENIQCLTLATLKSTRFLKTGHQKICTSKKNKRDSGI